MDPITIGVGLAGLLGGIFGGGFEQESTSGMRLGPESALETGAKGALGMDLNQLRSLVNDMSAGSNAQNPLMRASNASNQDLIGMLEQLRQTGGMPGEQDVNQARGFTGQLFAGQREQLRQGFDEQRMYANREAARLGRNVDDPILRAKLSQQQGNQFAQLAANESAETARIAMGMPGQRLQYQQMLTDFQGGLATQAFKNRAAIMEMGSNILANERQFRIATAEKYGTQKGEEGNFVSRGLTGAMAGVGAGLGMQSTLAQTGALNSYTNAMRQSSGNIFNTAQLAQFNPNGVGMAPTAPGMGIGLGSLGPWSK